MANIIQRLFGKKEEVKGENKLVQEARKEHGYELVEFGGRPLEWRTITQDLGCDEQGKHDQRESIMAQIPGQVKQYPGDSTIYYNSDFRLDAYKTPVTKEYEDNRVGGNAPDVSLTYDCELSMRSPSGRLIEYLFNEGVFVASRKVRSMSMMGCSYELGKDLPDSAVLDDCKYVIQFLEEKAERKLVKLPIN